MVCWDFLSSLDSRADTYLVYLSNYLSIFQTHPTGDWCMISNFNGYPGTGVCWYGRETQNCTSDELYIGKCLDHDTRQWFTFQNLGTTYSRNDDEPEILIQTTTGGEPSSSSSSPRCLARRDNSIYLDADCNPDDMRQRFFALGGALDGYRFELGQRTGYRRDMCVTNAHHPKSGTIRTASDIWILGWNRILVWSSMY